MSRSVALSESYVIIVENEVHKTMQLCEEIELHESVVNIESHVSYMSNMSNECSMELYALFQVNHEYFICSTKRGY